MGKPGPLGTTWQTTPSTVVPVGSVRGFSPSPRPWRAQGALVDADHLVGPAVPAGAEHRAGAGHGRPPGAPRGPPLATDLPVLRLVVRRLDHVLRPGERHGAVHDEDLAVVAQVRAPHPPVKGSIGIMGRQSTRVARSRSTVFLYVGMAGSRGGRAAAAPGRLARWRRPARRRTAATSSHAVM